jgi:ubiquinone biosynthesis protein
MEYIDGVKPRTRSAVEAAGLDPVQAAKNGADFVLRQVFEFGLFHTDPHPGNLLIIPGDIVVPLDFGQVARLSPTERRLLGELVLGIVDQDASSLVDAFEKEGMLDSRTDVNQLTRDIDEMLAVYHHMPIKDIPFAQMMGRTFELIRIHRVRPPAEFTLMLKSMMTIESVAVALNPEFRLIEALRPYARKMALEELDPRRLLRMARRLTRDTAQLAGRLPGDLNVILSKLLRGQFQVHIQHEHLEDLTRTFERSSNRVSFAMIIAGLLVGSSLLVTQQSHVLWIIDTQTLGILGYMVAAILGLGLLISIMRGGKL